MTRSPSVQETLDAVSSMVSFDAIFVVDHATDALRQIDGDDEVELRGDVRTAILRGQPFRGSDAVWWPVLDRREPVAVLRTAVDDSDTVRAAIEALGPSMGTQRRRLEDLERLRRRQSMSVAADVQWDLLPPRADRVGDWSVAAGLEPAYEVAGDLFDIAYIGGALQVVSLDGMGHGLTATLSTVAAIGAIRNARRDGATLVEQMEAASTVVHEEWHGRRFVTGLVSRVHEDGVEYVNAGHEPVRRATSRGVEEEDLDADLPLGVAGDASYVLQHRERLAPDDSLVLLSDGAAATTDDDGRALGRDGLDRVIRASMTDDAFESVHQILTHVLAHGSDRLEDDVTAVVVRAAGDR